VSSPGQLPVSGNGARPQLARHTCRRASGGRLAGYCRGFRAVVCRLAKTIEKQGRLDGVEKWKRCESGGAGLLGHWARVAEASCHIAPCGTATGLKMLLADRCNFYIPLTILPPPRHASFTDLASIRYRSGRSGAEADRKASNSGAGKKPKQENAKTL
jgi:hypothetical protein